MKIKELIAELQQMDPSGEAHLLIDNHDFEFWPDSLLPPHYDGRALVT